MSTILIYYRDFPIRDRVSFTVMYNRQHHLYYIIITTTSIINNNVDRTLFNSKGISRLFVNNSKKKYVLGNVKFRILRFSNHPLSIIIPFFVNKTYVIILLFYSRKPFVRITKSYVK